MTRSPLSPPIVNLFLSKDPHIVVETFAGPPIISRNQGSGISYLSIAGTMQNSGSGLRLSFEVLKIMGKALRAIIR